MIEIYLKTNTNYDKNGDITLTPSSCSYKDSEKILTLEHFQDEDGRWRFIEFENVISVEENEKKILYRIFNVVRSLYSVTAYARPIFYDLIDTVLLDVRPTEKIAAEALNIILADTPFTGHSNLTSINTAYYIRKNIVKALIGDIENSFINRWGGEFYCENFDVYINDRIGSDNGVRVEFGYNLNEIEEDVNTEDVVTRIIPVGFDGIMLAGDTPWVDSPLINKYTHIKMRVIEFSDIKVKENTEDEEGFNTIEEARAELVKRCKQLLKDGIDKPTVNYKIDMINLANTTAYKDFKMLVNVNKGDTVTCYIPHLDIDVQARVIDFEKDLLTGENTSLELGNITNDFFKEQSDINNKVDNIFNSNGNVKAETLEGAINALQTKFKALRDIAQPQQVRAILFEDRIEDSPTFGCMCLGTMGFEIASSFKPGTTDWDFRTFGTGKGFVADHIITGVLNASLIKAGILESENGKSRINMKDGTFNFHNKIKFDGKTFTIDLSREDLSSNESIKTLFNNIQVGGRNYIKDYKFKKDDVWKKSRKEAQIDTTQGYGYLSGTTENPFLYQDLESGLIKKGDTLTLQYEVKFDGVSGGTGTNSFLIRTALTGYLNNNSMVQDIGIFGKHESDGLYLNEGWQKVVKTITITSNAVFDYARFRLYARNFNGAIYFRNIKLEKGNKATDLSSAPEDISDKIQSNTTSISAMQGKISTLITDSTIKIDGKEVKIKDACSSLVQDVSSITTTVSSTETKFNNLKIGGRNLLSGTKDFTGSGISGRVLSENYNYKGFPVLYGNNSKGSNYIDLVYWNNSIDVKPSTEYTLSFYAKGKGQIASYFYPSNIESGYSSEGIKTDRDDGQIIHVLTKDWKKYSLTWKTLPTATGLKNVLPMRLLAGAIGYICGVKFEEGNKDTDWSPSHEEIDKNISNLETRVKSAEQKITDDAIVNTVKYHQTDGVNTFALSSDVKQTADGINRTLKDYSDAISGLGTRVKTVEENITTDAIVNTIKHHQTNGENTFATSSQLTQTTDAWEAKFSSKGGYNLIKNGDVTRHRLDFWWTENGANIWHEGHEWIGIYKHSDIEGFLVSETIRVEPGKTYSFSCQVEAEGATLGARVFFIGSSSNNRAYEWTPCLGSVANGESKNIEYTFTVPHNINYGFIRLGTNGSTNYSGGFVCWFKHMVLIEGSVPAKTFIPYKNEIYEGNTKIDRNGVEIYEGGLKVINSNGTVTIDASKLMLRILTYGQGSIVIPNGSQTATVTIRHNLGYNPIFKGQIGYINTSGGTEYYSDSLCLFKVSDGTVNYNVRMFVNTTELKIIAWRAKDLANSGTKTFYYRWFIQEGVNL